MEHRLVLQRHSLIVVELLIQCNIFSICIFQLGPVYEGKKVFIDWKSGIGPAIFKQYQLPSGERLIHESPNPVFMPNYPGKVVIF